MFLQELAFVSLSLSSPSLLGRCAYIIDPINLLRCLLVITLTRFVYCVCWVQKGVGDFMYKDREPGWMCVLVARVCDWLDENKSHDTR